MNAGRRFRAVLFDLPGTIISTDDNLNAHLHLMESLVERYGLPDEPVFLLEKFNARISEPYERLDRGWVSHRETVTAVLGGFLKARSVKVRPRDEEWFYDEYLRKHQAFVRLLPGAQALLASCAGLKLHLAALCNMDRDYLEKQLKWLDALDRFDSLTTPEDAGAPLPDGRMLSAALARAAAHPGQAIFVGSSVERAVAPARRLGLTTVLVDAGMVQTDLSSADYTASHLARVANIIVELAYGP